MVIGIKLIELMIEPPKLFANIQFFAKKTDSDILPPTPTAPPIEFRKNQPTKVMFPIVLRSVLVKLQFDTLRSLSSHEKLELTNVESLKVAFEPTIL